MLIVAFIVGFVIGIAPLMAVLGNGPRRWHIEDVIAVAYAFLSGGAVTLFIYIISITS